VGAASSVTSIQVANLLRLFKIPQVSVLHLFKIPQVSVLRPFKIPQVSGLSLFKKPQVSVLRLFKILQVTVLRLLYGHIETFFRIITIKFRQEIISDKLHLCCIQEVTSFSHLFQQRTYVCYSFQGRVKKYYHVIVWLLDGFWINGSIYCTLWYSMWLHFTVHYYKHTSVHTTVTSSLPLLGSVFNGGRCPFSGFLNYPRASATSCNSNSSQRLNPKSPPTHNWFYL
jgi:hypothetical protein